MADPRRTASITRVHTPWPAGGGQLGALVRANDWSQTRLGRIESWPRSLRTTVEVVLHSPVPMVLLWGPDGVMLYNDAYSEFAGGRHPQLLGAEVLEGWPEVADFNRAVMQAGLAGRTLSFTDQPLVLHRHGVPERVWLNLYYSPVYDETGCPAGVLAVVVETTKRVLAERENARLLAQSRNATEQLRQMFEQAPGMMSVTHGPSHVITMANHAYERFIGHRDVIGKTAAEAFPEFKGQGFLDLLDEVYRTGKPFIGRGKRVQLQRVPGAELEDAYVDFVYQPLLDADGNVTGIFGQGNDVTEQHRAMEALRDSEERFRLVAQSSALGTFDIDPVAETMRLSPAAVEMFDLDTDFLPRGVASQRIHPDDADQVAQDLERVLGGTAGGLGDVHIAFRVRRRDGSVRWLEVIGQVKFARQPDGARRAIRFAGVIWDVSTQQELVHALQEANRRKDEFLAMLAHELRNPLAPLTNALRVLERSTALTERDRSMLAIAQRQRGQLARLVDDLLEVSRITSGKIELRCEPLTVGAAVHAAVESLMPTLEHRAQHIEIDVPPRPVRIVADPARIAQVLENLLNNASKYTPEGGSIRVVVQDHRDEVEIQVCDNGIGIDPEHLSQLFELFSQIDATLDRAQGGLGIGLALVKRLVEMHGGTVSAASAGRGRGSTFSVRLPKPAESAPAKQA